jgi:hypothetical protein
MRSIRIGCVGTLRSRSEIAINRDFPNTRDRLRRLESVNSDARLTRVQPRAPVESTLQQESTRLGLPQKRAVAVGARSAFPRSCWSRLGATWSSVPGSCST